MINKILWINTERHLADHSGLAEAHAVSEAKEALRLSWYFIGCHEIGYWRDLREFLREHKSHSNALAVHTNCFVSASSETTHSSERLMWSAAGKT